MAIWHWRVIVVAAALLSSCAQPQAPAPAGAIVVGVRIAPNNLDPRFANDETSQRVGQLVFSSLMDIGDDLRVKPTLAERLDNPDPLTYIVTIRRGVTFHDGRALTSKDIVFNYSQYLDPAFISPFKGAFKVLQSVRALDDYRVEFRLKEPFGAFPIQLVSPPIVPAGAGQDFGAHPIGSGPYRFVRYDVDDKVVLAPFKDYFGGAPVNNGLILKVVPDDTMRGLELRKGSVDLVVNDLPPDMVYEFEKEQRFTLAQTPGLDYSYLGFNMRDPVVADKRIRYAIAYAVDQRAIVDYLRRGLARRALGLLPSQAWAFEPDVRQFTFSPARAKQLLDEAGYRDPDGDGPLPRLRLSLKISTNEETRLQSTVIQEDLRRVGIDLDVRSYEFATFYADVIKGNFQIFSLQWVGGALVDPDILRRVFHSTQTPPAGFNRGHYSNPEVDRLIDLASTAATESERKAYYGAAQKLIAEDAPYISLWNRTNVAVAQRTLSGLHLNTYVNFETLKDVVKK